MKDDSPQTDDASPLRLIVQQVALPKYRIPVFRELASRPGIDLAVVYAPNSRHVNAEPDGFEAIPREVRWLPGGFMWHDAQLEICDPARADVVSLSWNSRFLSLGPALRRARRAGIGSVVWGHGFSKKQGALRGAMRRRLAGRADAAQFYTPGAAEAFVAEGFPRERTFVALNAIDQSPVRAARAALDADPARLGAFRERLGLAGGPVLLFVSRLEPLNRLDLLLEAAARLRDDHPGLRVLVVGDGADRARLEEITDRLALRDAVHFAGAVYGEDELAPYFASATAYVYPAHIGLSLLHAFGYALPVITDDGPMHGPEIEALTDGENGLVYREGDLDGLVGKIRALLDDPGLRDRLGAGAERTVTERYSIATMVDGMVAAARFAAGRARQARAAS